MNKLFAAFGLMTFGVLLSAVCILPFSVYVILDIAKLFNVERVLIIPKEAMYGLMIILSILTVKMKKKSDKEKDKDTTSLVVDMIMSYVDTVLILLISWGIAYVVHAINF
jgi:hypothetical protein